MGTTTADYYLDGGNVVGEKTGTGITTYLRGSSLISGTSGSTTQYYLHNAHGDVVNLTNSSGTSTKAYQYDAFGNEKNPSSTDTNPFRYCGEYLDKETNEYYLRARYYDSSLGRFSQVDTHWNPGNMSYGDTLQQIGEYRDALGLNRYVYAPQQAAITQAGNLYVYCINNPIGFSDPNGGIAITTIILIASAAIGLIAGGVTAYQSNKYTGQIDWENTITTGLSWFMMAYTLGMTAYGVYLMYCDCKGITPVEEVSFNAKASIASGNQMTLDISFDAQKIQHEFKHATHYAINGNWNNENKRAFEQAIREQVSCVQTPIVGTYRVGTYRGEIPVLHYYDTETGIDTMIDLSGNFVAGWKLSEAQKQWLLSTGNVQ